MLEIYIKSSKEEEIIFILQFRKISINFVSNCAVCAIIYMKEKKSKELFFFFKNFEIVNSVLFSIESRDQNET